MLKLMEDSRFADNTSRCKHNAELINEIKPFFFGRTMAELEGIFSCRYFAASSVIDAEEVTEHPHFLQRQMIVEVDDPNVGLYQAVGLPVKFEKTATGIYRASPLLGQHTIEILEEFGYSPEEIKVMEEKGVIGC
jgi:crotonobetainyl-CoA:carnitine CoA-transferase CaiB-like acyl-CoA transferase